MFASVLTGPPNLNPGKKWSTQTKTLGRTATPDVEVSFEAGAEVINQRLEPPHEHKQGFVATLH
jgi:hypothetical protein